MTRRGATDTFTGTLKTNDPRRFLVEAMLGAMAADRKIREAEIVSMQHHLEEHEVFSGLTEAHHKVLLDIARDAISFVPSPIDRIPAIAKGLPSRLHKLMALSMACEVVVADTFIDKQEVRYLVKLRLGLRMTSDEFESMFLAAQEHRCARDLDARVTHLRAIVPTIVDLFALRSLSLGVLTPTHRAQIVELLRALPDLEVRAPDHATLVDKSYARMDHSMDLDRELQKVATALPDPIDRFWSIVYLMCADTIAAVHWRNNPFFTALQRVFGIDQADMDLAAIDATGFASTLPRVG